MVSAMVRDARTVILVERLLNEGYVIYSERKHGAFYVSLTPPDDEVFPPEPVTGNGVTFPLACYDALAQLAPKS